MHLASAFSVVLTSAVKLFFAAPLSYGLGHSLVQTILLLAGGGVVGMLVFYGSANWLLGISRQRYLRKRKERVALGKAPKPVFTRTNRTLIRVKSGYGFWGIAALGPPVISIPVSALLAAKYFRNDARTLPTLLLATIIWSVVLSCVWSFLR